MSCSRKSIALNLLTFRRLPHLYELKERYIPKPARNVAISTCGLPLWSRLPLEAKIPLLPNNPSHTLCTLTRRKLGQNLRINRDVATRDEDFDMNDPYGYEVKLDYEGMHDKHLTKFFRGTDSIREYLIKKGLLTSQLDVKCTLKEYNEYRNYLRLMQGKSIKKELQRQDNINKEKMMLRVAELLISKKKKILEKEEKHRETLKKLQLKEREKIQEIIEKQKKDAERVQIMQYKKYNNIIRKKLDKRIKKKQIVQKLTEMVEAKHQKTLNVLRTWHERDYRIQKSLDIKTQKKENDIRLKALRRFEAKKKCQEAAIEKENLTKECTKKLKQSFIEKYEKKIYQDRNKLQNAFLKKRKALERYLAKPHTNRKKTKKKCTCRCKIN